MGRTTCTEPQCLYKDALYLPFLTFFAITEFMLRDPKKSDDIWVGAPPNLMEDWIKIGFYANI
jgi:hypothetical protein